jgi:hypothetical protein
MRRQLFSLLISRVRLLLLCGFIEEIGHWLGVSWAVTLAAFLVGVTGLRMSSATAQVKAAHQRIDALVPAVGTAQSTANSASSAASTAQSTANSAQSTANNCLPLSGGTLTGALTVNGNIKSHSDLLADGTVYVNSSSLPLNIPQARATGLTAAPSSYNQTWGGTVVSAITQLNTNIQAANVLT